MLDTTTGEIVNLTLTHQLRVEYLIAEKVSEADSDHENTLAMSAHG
jgi:hypothetical protein